MKETEEVGLHDEIRDEVDHQILSGVAPKKTSHTNQLPFYSTVCTPGISKLLSILIFLICLGLILAIVTYRGSFSVWKYPLSDLGTLYTEHNKPNLLSRLIFDITMVISGFIMIKICSDFASNPSLRHSGMKSALTFICALGFFILIFPYDVINYIHEAGATFVFGSFWIMVFEFSMELKHSSSTLRFLLSQIVLQGTVLPYALLFTIGTPLEEAVQKFAVAGLMFALWLTTRQMSIPKAIIQE